MDFSLIIFHAMLCQDRKTNQGSLLPIWPPFQSVLEKGNSVMSPQIYINHPAGGISYKLRASFLPFLNIPFPIPSFSTHLFAHLPNHRDIPAASPRP